MSLRLVTPPVEEPVSVDEAKSSIRVQTDLEDAEVDSMIRAARQEIDGSLGRLGRAILTQTWDLGLEHFPGGGVRIPLPPCQSIVSVKYWDEEGIEQVVSSSDYILEPRGWDSSVLLPARGKSWPSLGCGSAREERATIRFICGWAAPDQVPDDIRKWLKAEVGSMYNQRESISIGTPVHRVHFYDGYLAKWRVWG